MSLINRSSDTCECKAYEWVASIVCMWGIYLFISLLYVYLYAYLYVYVYVYLHLHILRVRHVWTSRVNRMHVGYVLYISLYVYLYAYVYVYLRLHILCARHMNESHQSYACVVYLNTCLFMYIYVYIYMYIYIYTYCVYCIWMSRINRMHEEYISMCITMCISIGEYIYVCLYMNVECVQRIWTSLVKRMNTLCSHAICMSRVTRIHQSCRTWVHAQMRHVEHTNDSYHTYKWVLSRMYAIRIR